MYSVTKIKLEQMSLQELLKARDAIDILSNLAIDEVDIDVIYYVRELINKKEQTII